MGTAIWLNEEQNWRQLEPIGFQDEKALHDLVEDAPHLLPLAGSPRLVVVGREVRLGTGYADLLAIEPSGRLVVIEVKLANNAEARRAVVAQILAYAAYLYRLDPEVLEGDVLKGHLIARNFGGLKEAIAETVQEPSFDSVEFMEALSANLSSGTFRLVLVLDSAPEELVQLTGYLETIAPELTLDLVTVSAYEVGGKKVLVPQRVEPERVTSDMPRKQSKPAGQIVDGGDEFEQWIESEPDHVRTESHRIYVWAKALEGRGLARLRSYRGPEITTLLIYAKGHEGGLASAWNGRLYLYRSVFERRAPDSIPRVEAAVSPGRLGQGTVVSDLTDEVFQALTAAYEEAALSS